MNDLSRLTESPEYATLLNRMKKDWAELVSMEVADENARQQRLRNEYMRKYMNNKLKTDVSYQRPRKKYEEYSKNYFQRNKDKIINKRKRTFCEKYDSDQIEHTQTNKKKYERYQEEMRKYEEANKQKDGQLG